MNAVWDEFTIRVEAHKEHAGSATMRLPALPAGWLVGDTAEITDAQLGNWLRNEVRKKLSRLPEPKHGDNS